MHASLYEDKQTNIYIQTLTASLTANRLTEAILTLSNFWGTKLTTSPKDSAPYLWYGKIKTPSCQRTKNWERLPQTPKCYTIKYRLKSPSNCYRHVCSSKRKPYPPVPAHPQRCTAGARHPPRAPAARRRPLRRSRTRRPTRRPTPSTLNSLHLRS